LNRIACMANELAVRKRNEEPRDRRPRRADPVSAQNPARNLPQRQQDDADEDPVNQCTVALHRPLSPLLLGIYRERFMSGLDRSVQPTMGRRSIMQTMSGRSARPLAQQISHAGPP